MPSFQEKLNALKLLQLLTKHSQGVRPKTIFQSVDDLQFDISCFRLDIFVEPLKKNLGFHTQKTRQQ